MIASRAFPPAMSSVTVATRVPCASRFRFVATRDADGTNAMVYAPIGRNFIVRLSAIHGCRIHVWWFNSRDGYAASVGTFEKSGEREVSPPERGEMLDWVLVLDDEWKNHSPPSTSREIAVTSAFAASVRRGGAGAAFPSPDRALTEGTRLRPRRCLVDRQPWADAATARNN
jgi:hypothetical protein